MFHIKSLELVHWDYWQRIKNIPLDAKIITIAGQNGSGKTTLLDALRTLFGLDCSNGRSYKHYARHSGQQTAWLRAVVDNKPIDRQLSNRPFRLAGFFADDEVTLFCQIQKNGGDWKRQYLLRGGNVEIEDVQEASDWIGLDTYRKRLASAGLSSAMAKVLALEQGETDKLCEYSPRQLLDLVFQVFGDKEVLDAYDEAKHHQQATEVELKQFEAELESAKTNLERLRLRVANYHLWENLNKERRDLREEILPTLEFHELRETANRTSGQLRDAKQSLATHEEQISAKRAELAQHVQTLSEAQAQETQWETEHTALGQRLSELNAALKSHEELLAQKRRLQEQAAVTSDAADAAGQLEAKDAELSAKRQERFVLAEKIAGHRETMQALENNAPMRDPDPVVAMQKALREAGVGYAMLSDVIEVSDPDWQRAVEGVLRSYAYVILLENAGDAGKAYRLAERLRYGHFIVPDRVKAQVVKDDSLLSVVRFNGTVPSWLVDQLARIERVDSVEEGARSKAQEWITPDAYHRERRGGRSLHVDEAQFRFGHSGRTRRLAALRESVSRLEEQEDALTLRISGLSSEVANLKLRIAGVKAAEELVARQDEFEEAQRAAEPLKQARTEVGARLAELSSLAKPATEKRTRAQTAWESAKEQLARVEESLRDTRRKQREDRGRHAGTLTSLRRDWRHLPYNWRRPARRSELVSEHENAHQVQLRLNRLSSDLERDDWETDDTVVDQFTRLNTMLQGRQEETDERRYQNTRAIEATANARGAYIERLRYTIKTYGRNIKELGELAGIEVHTDPVRLENDDVLLTQAGLHVKFKFDGKAMIGMNDGEASGGQQVMKSLILLIGLLKSEDGSGGFVFIDEPFAHLDIRNIQLVGEFLKNTDAQYLMTTPLTHNTDVYDPSELTLVTNKKKKEMQWAQPIFVLQRRMGKAA
ncbi:MAG: AAA family ATPase [Burkholderiaceae bacterium]|nr:AAA family ATPase [Burkholderiaceae bacterium]